MKKITFILIASTSLMGCMPPPYIPKNINQTVAVNAEAAPPLRLCLNSKLYSLIQDKNHYVRVPYGKIVSIAGFFSIDTGFHIISCNPKFSFLPIKNNKYYFNLVVQKSDCYIEVFRYTPDTRIGLTPDNSFAEYEKNCPNPSP